MRGIIVFALAIALALPAAAAADCETEPVGEGARLTLARPVAGSVLREFGLTYDERAQQKTEHNGVDLESAIGENVYAARSGTVAESASRDDLGTYVRIDHGAGVMTVYGNLSEALVKAGDCVTGGAVFAKSGASGLAPRPQLHFEVWRNGAAVNPLEVLQ